MYKIILQGIIRSHGSYAYLKENGDKIFEKANSAGEDVDSLTVEDEQEVVAKQVMSGWLNANTRVTKCASNSQ